MSLARFRLRESTTTGDLQRDRAMEASRGTRQHASGITIEPLKDSVQQVESAAQSDIATLRVALIGYCEVGGTFGAALVRCAANGRSILLPMHVAEWGRRKARLRQRWHRSLRLLSLFRVDPAALRQFALRSKLRRNAVSHEGVRRRLFRCASLFFFLPNHRSQVRLVSKPIATCRACGGLLGHAKHLRRYDGFAMCHNIGRTIQLL